MESYAELATQPESLLRELLEHEIPRVRLHAAWALGMRQGPAAAFDIASRAGREPSGGVRQHLMIMLAGSGEKAILATFAALDPDPLVRATACQYLGRLAGPSDLALHEVLLDRAANDPDEDVRCAAIQNLRVDTPPSVCARLLGIFPRASLEVQKVTTGRLVLWSETPRAMLAALTDAPAEVLLHAFELLRERFGSAPWSDLAPWAQSHGDDTAVVLRIADLLCDSPECGPVTFWARVAESWGDVGAMSPEAPERLIGALERAFAAVIPGDLPAPVRHQLAELRWKVECRVRRGEWRESFRNEWYAILALLNQPREAEARRLISPGGRLVAQIILSTLDYEGPSPEELRKDRGRWLR